MSHNKLRKETNCLNCDAQVDGRYCKNCGQENIEPKQTLWHLITHFFNDITHFDSKFFVTMKTLLFKPGFLTSEYVKGRRKKYLDPIRMYLFVSFVFFLLYLTVTKNDIQKEFNYEDNPVAMHMIDTGRLGMESRKEYSLHSKILNNESIMWINFSHKYRHGIKHYDSIQKALPKSKRPSLLWSYYDRKLVYVARAYEKDPYTFLQKFIDNLRHSFSKIFFISLPIFSFILALLYIRRRKEFYYVSHAIFSIHCYTVAWFFFVINSLAESAFSFVMLSSGWISGIIYIGLLVYLFIAMLRFYKQGAGKTFLKYIILLIIMVIVLFLIILGIAFDSFFVLGSH